MPSLSLGMTQFGIPLLNRMVSRIFVAICFLRNSSSVHKRVSPMTGGMSDLKSDPSGSVIKFPTILSFSRVSTAANPVHYTKVMKTLVHYERQASAYRTQLSWLGPLIFHTKNSDCILSFCRMKIQEETLIRMTTVRQQTKFRFNPLDKASYARHSVFLLNYHYVATIWKSTDDMWILPQLQIGLYYFQIPEIISFQSLLILTTIVFYLTVIVWTFSSLACAFRCSSSSSISPGEYSRPQSPHSLGPTTFWPASKTICIIPKNHDEPTLVWKETHVHKTDLIGLYTLLNTWCFFFAQ